MKYIRVLLFLVLSIILFYQETKFVIKLIRPSKVNSVITQPVKDIASTLITVCPEDQYNSAKYEKYDYENIMDMHIGKTMKGHTLSWGAHYKNNTFGEMVNDILDDDDLENVAIQTDVKAGSTSRLYLPFLGNCLQYKHKFKDGNWVIVSASNYSKPLAVFVTDPNYSTHYGIKIDSQVGDNIRVYSKIAKTYTYNIALTVKINSERSDCHSTQQSFRECIDEKLSDGLKCVPPWLGTKNTCEGTLSWQLDFYLDLLETVKNIIGGKKIPAEIDCEISNPCPRKFYKVDLQREIAELNPDTSTVILVFDPEFQKEELVNDYDLFQFLADSGGAMGLWLGLSVLSMYDALIIFKEWIMKKFNGAFK